MPMHPPTHRRGVPLLLLLGISTCAFIDRSILNTVGQALKDDLHLSDLQLGLLGGAAFALLYIVFCVPVARLSERHSRIKIVSGAVVVWCVMTMLCGLASSFALLLLARVGVGIGEAGVTAPSQSLLADFYPPGLRASALSILGLATPLGVAIGGIGGGYFAQHLGWRGAFFIAGLPGLLLAALLGWKVREPNRGAADAADAPIPEAVPSLGAVLRRLWSCRTFRHMLAAGMITAFIGYGTVTFMHAFFVRAYSMDYGRAGIAFALINSVPNACGFLIGGFVTDRLIRRDIRFYGWLPAAGALLAFPLSLLGLVQTNPATGIAILFLPGLFSATWFAPTFAVTQNLVSARMRASAVAVLTLGFTLVGMSCGPAATGALSDFFARRDFAGDYASRCTAAGAAQSTACHAAAGAGLRVALILVSSLFLWSAIHFLLASRHMPRELRAGIRGG